MKLTIAALFAALSAAVGLFAADGEVKISCGHPGGNVKINELAPGRAQIEADLRDTAQPWFYWSFDAIAETPGTVRFLFPVRQKQISAQGPAVSSDGGNTWRWLGKEKTVFFGKEPEGQRDSFTWTFAKAGETVRFAQGMPYLKRDFDAFLRMHAENPHLKVTVLTKTRKGAETPLLIIGREGAGKKPVLMTARHHCCEAIASYTLEGILDEALSDTPSGRAFREKYVLFVVPFVDLDGVQAGDQGKGRAPHDHNRDYGRQPNIYPEIEAIEALHKQKKMFVTLDFHAPFVRGDIHEAFYFDGWRSPENDSCTQEFRLWIGDEVPSILGKPLNLGKPALRKGTADIGQSYSHYFAADPDVHYAMTLEIPYANSRYDYDGAMAREYGRGCLHAMMRMEFGRTAQKRTGHAEFSAMGERLTGRPDAVISAAQAILNDPNASELYKAEARLRLGWLYPRLKRYADAVACNEQVLASLGATRRQKDTAAVQKTQALCADPGTSGEALRKWQNNVETMKVVGVDAYQLADAFYQRCMRDNDAVTACQWAQKQLRYAPRTSVGMVRNRIAALDIAAGRKEKAAAYSRQTVEILRTNLDPMPVGIFGPQQALELVKALQMIPGTPKQEIVDAANRALNHKHCPPQIRTQLNGILDKIPITELFSESADLVKVLRRSFPKTLFDEYTSRNWPPFTYSVVVLLSEMPPVQA